MCLIPATLFQLLAGAGGGLADTTGGTSPSWLPSVSSFKCSGIPFG